MRDPFPACSGKNSRHSRRISRGGALHRKGERNSSIVPPFQESPRCLSPSRGTCFPCTESTFTSRTDSYHGGPLDSPVGKRLGKASRENLRSLDPDDGKRDTTAKALEESAHAWPHSRRGITPLGRLEKYPKIHGSIGGESSGSGPDSHKVLGPKMKGEEPREAPEQLAWGLAFTEATRAGR